MARSIKLLGAIALAATAACSTDPISPSTVAAARHPANATAASTNSILVTESDIARQPDNTAPTRSWVFYTSGPTPTGVFRYGPGDPPLGVGSFEMSTTDVLDHGTLFNFDHVDTRLDAINAISYSTYRELTSIGAPHILPSINIAIDKDGPPYVSGDFATLVFEPIYNTQQGPVVPDVWQTWDGISGNWWSTRDFLPAVVRGVTYPWSYFVETFPNATILGGFGVNQGSYSADLTAATDALTLGVGGTTWIYNFEPYRAPASKDECKNGGWQTFKTADGSSFKNQGQCIKYVDENSGQA
jgi:hypothetical protein